MKLHPLFTATLLSAGVIVASPTVGTAAAAAPVPASCPTAFTRAVPVSNTATLTLALLTARPGDEIQLAPGTYTGNFVSTVPGTSAAPVIICGDAGAILDGATEATGYVLYIRNAPYTDVYGITVTNGSKGVLMDNASHSLLSGITVHAIGQEGVHLRRFTTDTTVRGSTIYDTGQVASQYGEGIYVGSANNNWCTYTNCNPDASDDNSIVNNHIGPGVGAEEVDVKEGTTGGLISGNTFDGTGMDSLGAQSWVDVKGNDWTLTGNTGHNTVRHGFTDSLAYAGWGNGNLFTSNVEYVNSTGYGVKVATGVTGVVVTTSNVVIGARSGVSNIPLTNG